MFERFVLLSLWYLQLWAMNSYPLSPDFYIDSASLEPDGPQGVVIENIYIPNLSPSKSEKRFTNDGAVWIGSVDDAWGDVDNNDDNDSSALTGNNDGSDCDSDSYGSRESNTTRKLPPCENYTLLCSNLMWQQSSAGRLYVLALLTWHLPASSACTI